VALSPQVELVAEDFRLPPLECEVRVADQKSDVTNKLLSSLKRSGWVTRVSMQHCSFFNYGKVDKSVNN